jgi:fumarate hydratase subunit beta
MLIASVRKCFKSGNAMDILQITTPLTDKVIMNLKVGEKVLLSGVIYTARDAAHKRFMDAIKRGESLPIDLQGQVIYYCGPSPAGPGRIIGSAGPTTSSRMDSYTPTLLELGLKGMIGKGRRSKEVINSLKEHKAVYFGATGGAGALLSQSVESYEIVAYDDLGPEALARLYVKDLPLFVVNDTYGCDLYEIGAAHYRTVPYNLVLF